jgi:hypothetical protein
MHKLFIIFLFSIFLLKGNSSILAQTVDPKNDKQHKDQYGVSQEKIEQESQDEMKKQNDEFARKKRYRSLTRKGKAGTAGKARTENGNVDTLYHQK